MQNIRRAYSSNPHLSRVSQDSKTKFVPDRPGHDTRYAIDATKIMKEIKWKPVESFESGLKKTIKWYLDNSKWCERVLDGTYMRQRLGSKDCQHMIIVIASQAN